ncbi:RNA polymerase sigma-70 factor [Kribbella sp. NPDC051770]|uniref:RNA polymerase sigma-70 factor n=1 Tax=Kribbella sp. NPDC051770 TaxID=3155413 RepID=UPI0034140B3B
MSEVDVRFDQVRPRLFGIAYRMLGSVADAEDVVQDAWLRFNRTDPDSIRNAPGFLAKTTIRLAITAATSARARREVYVGPWLPEPLSTAADPLLGAERSEAVDLAVLMLLERLGPRERAAYILREAFDYPFRLIAEVLETSEPNARQLNKRARAHLEKQRHLPVDAAEHRRLLDAFLAAARTGDLAQLEKMLAASAVSYSDGGGIVTAARVPIHGRTDVARFIAGIVEKFSPGTTDAVVEVNGRPALLITQDGVPVLLAAIDATAIGIERLMLVSNPEKLTGVAELV